MTNIRTTIVKMSKMAITASATGPAGEIPVPAPELPPSWAVKIIYPSSSIFEFLLNYVLVTARHLIYPNKQGDS